MAEVYLARARGIQGFEKLVALKVIRPEHADDPDFVQMFLDEARLAATLQHPAIAQVFDIGEAASTYFFALEYVDGATLRAIQAEARAGGKLVPLEHAVNIVLAVAAALHHAHEQRGSDGQPLQIVHRDVSPSNVIVSYEGAAKLLDFGIAKAAGRMTTTRMGVLKGKVAYMSPEQCNAEPLDRRSDIFSLGIVLYELTTGQRLFDGENEIAVAKQVTTGEIPLPSSRVPGYPPALEAIVLRTLARDQTRRYATAHDVAADLEVFAREQHVPISSLALGAYVRALLPPTVTPEPVSIDTTKATVAAVSVAITPVSRPRSRRRVLAIAGLLAVAAVGIVGVLLWRARPPNLLLNGGFEFGTANWLGVRSTLGTEPEARSGRAAARVCFTGGGPNYLITDQPNSARARRGEVYVADAWVRASPDNPSQVLVARLTLMERTKAGDYIAGSHSLKMTIDDQWRRITMIRTVSSEAAEVDLSIVADTTVAKSCFLVDDMSLIRAR